MVIIVIIVLGSTEKPTNGVTKRKKEQC